MSESENQSAKELLIFNSMLYTNSEKYIWISDSHKVHREAQRFFVCMLKKGIYIKGFATDKKSMVGLKMYNKKIYDINTLNQEKSVIFYDTFLGRFDVELPEKVQNARILNPDMPKDNIVIWGSGITGKRVHRILAENRVKIECFVDSNKALEGTYRSGVPVHLPTFLKEFEESPTIVEALEKWEEVDVCIRREYEKRFYFSFVENDIKKSVYKGRYIERLFNLMSWHGNFAHFIGRKTYVYGVGKIENEMARYLRMLDIDFGGFLVDEFNVEVRSICGNYDMKYVEDVLYERNFFIWVYDKKRVKKLDDLGLISYEDYVCYDGADVPLISKRYILDTNLGHSYLADSKYPGFTIYGNERKQDFRIVALGGSTTDGKIYSFKSWPELMYEELRSKGLEDITVYNGGVSGYASGQELLKLIRDVIPMKPDMVIVYDGFNDLNMHFPYPLTNGYIKRVFEFAQENIERDEDDLMYTSESMPICQGIEAKEDMFCTWLSNIRTMYAVAKEWNIPFYCFCQPMLGSKEGKTETEKSMLLSVHSHAINNLMKEAFRSRICQMDELPEYIHDLSHIFDYETDVYLDHCHVKERGNRIIAEKIIDIIFSELSDAHFRKEN